MRYVFGFLMALAVLAFAAWVWVLAAVALPQGASAEASEEGAASAGPVVHAKHHLPPQLMLRASYFLYLDADTDADATSDQAEPSAEEPRSAEAAEQGTSPAPNAKEPAQSTQPPPSRLERWHPEAFEDQTKPASEPALKLELDSGDLEVTPTAPEQTQKKKLSPGAKAGIAVGVIVGVGLIGFGIGAAVAMSNFEL